MIKSMFIQTWGEVFSASLQGLWLGFVSFVPSLILAIIIFIIGWVVGSVVGRAIAQVIEAVKLDKLFDSIGATRLFEKAGMLAFEKDYQLKEIRYIPLTGCYAAHDIDNARLKAVAVAGEMQAHGDRTRERHGRHSVRGFLQ